MLGQHQVTLNTMRAEIPVKPGNDQQDVDIGREQLSAECRARLFAGEHRAARQDGLDCAPRPYGDPVADNRCALVFIYQPAGRRSVEFTGIGHDSIDAGMRHGHAPSPVAGVAVAFKGAMKKSIPSQLGEIHCDSPLCVLQAGPETRTGTARRQGTARLSGSAREKAPD